MKVSGFITVSLNPDPDEIIQYDEVLNNALVEAQSAYLMNLKDTELKLTIAFVVYFVYLTPPNTLWELKETNWSALDDEQALDFMGKNGQPGMYRIVMRISFGMLYLFQNP